MRYRLLLFAVALLISACTHRAPKQPAPAPVGFLDKVWTVVESPGGSGDLYVFLSDGTFVRAAKEAVPDVGKWSWDGKQLTVLWNTLPYTADIDSLTESYFGLTFHLMNRSFEIGLAPATASMPDTTRTVEFDPTEASINASGDNPAWLLEVENDRAWFRTALYGTLNYDGEWLMEEPRAWVWEGHRQTTTGDETISFHLREATCEEEKGIELPFTAFLTRGDTRWTGCAVSGKLARIEKADSTK